MPRSHKVWSVPLGAEAKQLRWGKQPLCLTNRSHAFWVSDRIFISVKMLALVASHMAWPDYEVQTPARELEHFPLSSSAVITCTYFFLLTSSCFQLSSCPSLFLEGLKGKSYEPHVHMEMKPMEERPVWGSWVLWVLCLAGTAMCFIHSLELGKGGGLTSCMSSHNVPAYINRTKMVT